MEIMFAILRPYSIKDVLHITTSNQVDHELKKCCYKHDCDELNCIYKRRGNKMLMIKLLFLYCLLMKIFQGITGWKNYSSSNLRTFREILTNLVIQSGDTKK